VGRTEWVLFSYWRHNRARARPPLVSAGFLPPKQPPDSGEIDCHHTLLALVHRIYSQHLTGKLQLVFGRVEKALFFDAGELVFATSSDRQDGLGEVMLRAGALTQGQFEEASALVETGQRFGSAIAEMGIYGVEQIVSWVQRQLLQIIASVLDYPAGRYFFLSSLEKNVVPEIGFPSAAGKAAPGRPCAEPVTCLWTNSLRTPIFRLTSRLTRCAFLRPEDLENGERHLLGLLSQRVSAKHAVAQRRVAQARRPLAPSMPCCFLGFVVGVRDQIRPEPAPVVPSPPAEPEQPRAAEASSATKIPEQLSVQVSVPEEEATAKASESLFRRRHQARAASPRTDTGRSGGTERNGRTSYDAPPTFETEHDRT